MFVSADDEDDKDDKDDKDDEDDEDNDEDEESISCSISSDLIPLTSLSLCDR